MQHVLLGNCSFVEVFAGNWYTIPSLNPRETVQNVDLTPLYEPDENEFADDVPRDPQSVTLIT